MRILKAIGVGLASGMATRLDRLSRRGELRGFAASDYERLGNRWIARVETDMRIAALLVGLFTIVVGVLGIVSPDSLTTARRLYFATPLGLYGAAAIRVSMGLVLILSAAASRAPKILRALGAVMCLQALSATLLGAEHARAILEWETMHAALLRAGAVVAVAAGGFIVFAVTTGRRRELVIR